MKIIKYILLTLTIVFALCLTAYLNLNNYKYTDPITINYISVSHSESDAAAKLISKETELDYDTAKKYVNIIYRAANKYSLDPLLIMSIIYVESEFDHRAFSFGNYGLMQISYKYHKANVVKSKLFDPEYNIMAGAKIMNDYAGKTPTHMLIRYNGSENKHSYAKKVLSRYNKIKGGVSGFVPIDKLRL